MRRPPVRSRARPHGLRRFAIRIAVLALIAWTFEITTHVHATESHAGAVQAADVCLLCAAHQIGAGPPCSDFEISPAPRAYGECAVAGCVWNSFATSAYRSRAPPLA